MNRTPRWSGSTTPPLDEKGAIPCGSETREQFRVEGNAFRRDWWASFHDWFCRNHPPTRAPQV